MIRRPPGSTLIDTLFPDTTLFRSECGRAILALIAMRRAVLSGALPAAEQHPRLAAHDRGRPAGGSLRAVVGDQYVSRDLRSHLPAGPTVRRQLRHRTEIGRAHV